MKKLVLNTCGTGPNTSIAAPVTITGLGTTVFFCDAEDPADAGIETFFSVRFNPRKWDVQKNGLIYGDPQFLLEIKRTIKTAYPVINVDSLEYAERGMQWDDCVVFCADRNFGIPIASLFGRKIICIDECANEVKPSSVKISRSSWLAVEYESWVEVPDAQPATLSKLSKAMKQHLLSFEQDDELCKTIKYLAKREKKYVKLMNEMIGGL